MSIASALESLYQERDRLAQEQARIAEAIAALESLDSAPPKVESTPKRKDGRSAPKPPIVCPFCGDTARGMAGLAAHARGSHPDRYPEAYEEWKRQR